MKHFVAVLLLSSILFYNCAIQYASTRPGGVDSAPSIIVSVTDTMISVNNKPVVIRPRYERLFLSTLSGTPRGQEDLAALLDSLRIKEGAAQSDSSSREPQVSIVAGIRTKLLTVSNVIKACSTAQLKTAQITIRKKKGNAAVILHRPALKDLCDSVFCIITDNDILLEDGKDTVFQIPYREVLRYTTLNNPQGIMINHSISSEIRPRNPKTGKVFLRKDLQDILLCVKGDTLNTSIFETVVKNMKEFRKKNMRCPDKSPLLVIANGDFPMTKIFKLLQAAESAGYQAIHVSTEKD